MGQKSPLYLEKNRKDLGYKSTGTHPIFYMLSPSYNTFQKTISPIAISLYDQKSIPIQLSMCI